MELKTYRQEDLVFILELFYKTVHTINAADYTKRQLDAWAPEKPDREKWEQSLSAHYALIAREGGKLLGFGDIMRDGYLDRLYVAADFQGRGVGTALLAALEEYAFGHGAERIATYASLTAKPFFEKSGYRMTEEHFAARKGVVLQNFLMMKERQG